LLRPIFVQVNYQQTIDYLYRYLPMFSRVGAIAYKEDLHNTHALCQVLGDPHKKFKSIHVAGTNGKGSTSHMLAAILQESGYKTGLYTSPHLKDFRERIRINGEMIREDFVVDFVERTKNTTAKIEPSFFELTVAMAFDYFATESVDIAVIETGLGGRLDSTNVITPVLSVITNIGYDHMNILGHTLPEIAREKAGIIKPGVPVVIGEWLDETKSVFLERAKEAGSDFLFASDLYQVSDIRYTARTLECDVTDRVSRCREHFQLDLNGLYQVRNLCTVLAAEGSLIKAGFLIPDESEKRALANVKRLTGLHGRWEVIRENPTVVLDVAHNADGIRKVLQQLDELKHTYGKLNFVMGMVNDKDISKMLNLLPLNARYFFTNAHIPRALAHDELRRMAAERGLTASGYDDVNEAIRCAVEDAGSDGLVMVCGSVFVIGEVVI